MHHRVSTSPEDVEHQEISPAHSSSETRAAPRRAWHSSLAWSDTGERWTWVCSPWHVSEPPHSILGCLGADLGITTQPGGRRWAHVECPWGCQAPLIAARLFHCSTAGWFLSRSLSSRGCCLQKVRGRDLGWVQPLVQLCLSSPRSLAVRRAGPPAVPSPAFTAALPVRTNGTTQKINSSHLYDNTAPPVRMLHHCF